MVWKCADFYILVCEIQLPYYHLQQGYCMQRPGHLLYWCWLYAIQLLIRPKLVLANDGNYYEMRYVSIFHVRAGSIFLGPELSRQLTDEKYSSHHGRDQESWKTTIYLDRSARCKHLVHSVGFEGAVASENSDADIHDFQIRPEDGANRCKTSVLAISIWDVSLTSIFQDALISTLDTALGCETCEELVCPVIHSGLQSIFSLLLYFRY